MTHDEMESRGLNQSTMWIIEHGLGFKSTRGDEWPANILIVYNDLYL